MRKETRQVDGKKNRKKENMRGRKERVRKYGGKEVMEGGKKEKLQDTYIHTYKKNNRKEND